MKLGNRFWVAALVVAVTAHIANADLLMLLEGDVESGAVAVDSSGKGNHGLYLGSAGHTADGQSGGALNFNADVSYMLTHGADVGPSRLAASQSTAADGFAGINASQEYSIGFWLSGGDTNPRDSSTFWADGVTPNGGNRAIQTHITWSNSQIYLDQGGCCDAATQRLNGPLEEEFIKGSAGEEWTHYAFTAGLEDDIPFRRIYVNGEIFLEVEASAENAEVPIIDNFFIASDNNTGNQWEGRLDDFFVADNMLSPDDVADVYGSSARAFFGVEGTPDPVQATFDVYRSDIGTHGVAGEVTNVVMSEPQATEGLSQYWYDAQWRANPEAFLTAAADGPEAADLVAAPFASSTTWWAGSQNPDLITDYPIERYPSSGLSGTRFDGSNNEDNYSVRLTGEIFIPEDGEYLLRDGIDDYAMIAIDLDGNGELDDLDSVLNADVGQGAFGDIVVNDDDWANQDGSSQTPDFHGFADVENIDAGGEWRKIEIWMSEGGGGDAGILYMANFDDADVFDDLNTDALSQEEIDRFVVRNDQLRTTVAVVQSADSAAALDTSVEYLLQVNADGTSDALAVDDPAGVYNTTLDVEGATIRIQAEEGIAEGTSYNIVDADNIVGNLTILADDPSAWSFDSATGTLTFGAGGGPVCDPNTGGDIDGDGSVGFSDFLILSANFGGTATGAGHTIGDIDCTGDVAFSDFLVLSANFGNTVGAEASSVPEPSGIALTTIAGLLAGLVRRRR